MSGVFRVVFDCVVFTQALISHMGPAAKCLALAEQGRIQLFISSFGLDEIGELPFKLKPRFRIDDLKTSRFIQRIMEYTHLVDAAPQRFSLTADAADSPYLDLCAAVDAQRLVTWDHDLLNLRTAETAEAQMILGQLPSLRIVTPVELLAEVQA